MISSMPEYNITDLRNHIVETYRVGAGSRPEISLIEIDGQKMIIKDFGQSDPWFRFAVGRLLRYREERALRRLLGVKGIPRFMGRAGPHAVVMEYIEGKTAKQLKRQKFEPEFFQRLNQLINDMHARGIAHCDLRSGGNTIVDNEGQPYFVDFVGHFRRGAKWNLLYKWIFNRFCEADKVGAVRLKRRLAPELLGEDEKQVLIRDRKHLMARISRFIGGSIRNISRLILTGKK